MSPRTSARARDDDARLDAVFGALADRTRRAILGRLSEGSATVTELAAPFAMSLPAASRHLKVLEQAGLIQRDVQGRLHHCHLAPDPLRGADAWLETYRAFWDGRLAALERHVAPRTRRR
jgi:DNA-binding transcriptional ArsR family regulator